MTKIRKEILVSPTGTPHTEATKEQIGKANSVPKHKEVNKHKYILQNPKGEMFVLKTGITKFCEDNDLDRNDLRKVAMGERSHHKLWKASFYKEI